MRKTSLTFNQSLNQTIVSHIAFLAGTTTGTGSPPGIL
jgi:hypothetical protein